MKLKMPKNWNKLSNDEQRKWVDAELKKVREIEGELVKISRLLVSDKNYTPIMSDDDRPDLINMK